MQACLLVLLVFCISFPSLFLFLFLFFLPVVSAPASSNSSSLLDYNIYWWLIELYNDGEYIAKPNHRDLDLRIVLYWISEAHYEEAVTLSYIERQRARRPKWI